MRQNAAQLNRMQIREQEALNRQRRTQDDTAARREGEAVRRTQAQYSHVTSHGYGRSGGGAAGSSAPHAAGAEANQGPRRLSNSAVAHGDDVHIKVYVRECDDDARDSFTYREMGGAVGPSTSSPGRGGGYPGAAAASRGAPLPRQQPAANGGYNVASAAPAPMRGGVTIAQTADECVAPNRTRVPRYLQQRKAEMAAEKEAVALEAERQRQLSQVPPGHRRVSEDEKADTLRRIDERQQELETQLAKIPIRFDTQSIQQRRRAIEDELRELEAKRNKYSTKNPLYVPL